MHTVLSVAVVVTYVAVLTFVAVRARAAREFAEFSLARRALPLALVFGSLAATYVGPVFSIGFVGRGFKSGLLFLGVGLAYAVQNIRGWDKTLRHSASTSASPSFVNVLPMLIHHSLKF